MMKTYTDEQRAAIETTGEHLCVDAGAGSGKTMVLIERILRLLDAGTNLDEIVAITFTERAAGEMKERLRREAHLRAPQEDSRRMSFWRDVERRTDAARISTIHSFCMALLKEHALALGQDPDFNILNDAEGYLLRHDIAESVVHGALEAGDEAALRLVVELGGAKCIDELARLLKDRGKVQRALAATPHDDPETLQHYWNRTVDHIVMDGLNALRPAIEANRQTLLDLEGCCANPGDKRERMRIKLLAALTQLLQAANAQHAAAAAAELAAVSAVGGSEKNWPSKDAMAQIKDVRDTMKDVLARVIPDVVDPPLERHAAQLTCDMAVLYSRAADRYGEEKRQRAVSEFDDLILDTLEILRTRPAICAAIATTIRYLMIDEFQDTDNLQLELAERLAAVEGGPELFFVGDAKQSIYCFRGAEVEVFRKARGLAKRVIALDRNFRTTPDVLEFVNDLFRHSNLLQRVENPYRPMVAARAPAGQPVVELLLPPAPEDKTRAKESRQIEAAIIAQRILALVNAPEPLCIHDERLGASRPVRLGDIALLFRTTNGLYLYEQALKDAGLPYYVVAGSGFYERQEITDLRNLLHTVVDPHDTYALVGFLRSPIAGISDETLLHMQVDGGVPRAFVRLDYDGPQADAVHAARTLLEELRACADWPLPALMRHVLDRTAYEAILLAQSLGAQKAANVRKLVDLAETFGASHPASLRVFLRYLDEIAGSQMPEGEAAMLPEDGNAVILMTIHRAKGLEFPVVFVPNLGQKRDKTHGAARVTLHPEFGICLCPAGEDGETVRVPFAATIARDHREKEKAEYARLLYVAITRARDMLILSAGPNKPDVDSWLDHVNKMLQPAGRKPGQAIRGGDRWQWRVWTELEGTPAPITTGAPALFDPETLSRHIAPVLITPATRNIFGVTEVLDLMAPEAVVEADTHKRATASPALLRGSAVHLLFERWDFIADPRQAVERVLAELAVPVQCRAAMLDDLTAIAERVRNHGIAAELAQTTRDMRERPFLFRVGDALIRGEMDVLLAGGRVLDYKTGTRRHESEERYAWQLRLYAAAVDALEGAVADDAILFYVDSGDAVSIDVSRRYRTDALDRAATAIATLRTGKPAQATV